jgi:hypothetical protein
VEETESMICGELPISRGPAAGYFIDKREKLLTDVEKEGGIYYCLVPFAYSYL